MVSLRLWHWYSNDQALAATFFSRSANELEESPPQPSPDETSRGLTYAEEAQKRHRAFTTASIFASVAFLEACINELFASVEHDNLEVGGRLPSVERMRLVEMRIYLARLPALDRFQAALRLLGKQPFDRGGPPYQDAALLVRLRNALVHYEPRWRPAGSEVSASIDESGLTKALASKRFTANPFTGAGNPFFPDQCLGHGCTSWAWESALALADAFSGRLGVKAPYEHLRAELNP